MSNVGSPGGGSPNPWDGRPADGHGTAYPRHTPGYAGQPGGWGEPPASQRYAYEPPTQRYEPPAGWDIGQPAHPVFPSADPHPGGPPYPEPPRPRRGLGPLVAVLAVVVVLLGGTAVFWAFGRDDQAPVGGSGGPVSPGVDPSAEASEQAGPATTAAAPASSTDPRFVKAGQCVRNDGGVAQPKLVITECAPKTYEVLRRIDGRTSGRKDAEAKCAKVAGYTDWFFFDSELDTLDFVLCLRQR